MEFNVFEYFKGYNRTSSGPRTPEEQGTAFFLGGHLGPRISEHIDASAARAGLSRRAFLGTASALPATMLAVNKITGMRFFDVTEAEAYEPAAAKEIKVNRRRASCPSTNTSARRAAWCTRCARPSPTRHSRPAHAVAAP
jgi:hypothetical protein